MAYMKDSTGRRLDTFEALGKVDAADKYDKDARAAKLITVYAAIANRTNTPMDIFVIGDSIVEGVGAGTPEKKWTRHFLDALRTRYPTPGVVGGKGYVMAINTITSSYGLDAPTRTGNATVDIWGFGKRSVKLAATSGSGAGMAAFPNRTILTSFDICYRTEAADSRIEYSTDGGTVWTAVPGTAAGEQKFRVTPASRAVYPINVRHLSGGTTQLQGIMYYDGDEAAGIRIWPAGVSGTRAAQFHTGSNGYWNLGLAKATPSLAIVEWLTNDMTLRTPAEYKADILAIIGLLRSAVANVPVMLAPPWRRPNSATVGLAPWESYVTVLKEIVAADANTFYVDTSTRKPTDADTLGLLIDGLHPNDKGYALLGDHYARALLQ